MIDHDSVSILRAAAEVFRGADHGPLTRAGQLIQCDGRNEISKIFVVGDLHSELEPLKALIRDIVDELRNGDVLLCFVGDLVSNVDFGDFDAFFDRSPHSGRATHDQYAERTARNAYDLLLYVAKLKEKFPRAVHVLAGNAELGYRDKRATQSLRLFVQDQGPYVRRAVEQFVDSLPLFATVTLGKSVYLISHGGVVNTKLPRKLTALSDLENYNRNIDSFKMLCYGNDAAPPQDINDTSNVLGITAQIFGHYHLFGSKAKTEKTKLQLTNGPPDYPYRHTSDKCVHVINSMDWTTPATCLEVTSTGVDYKVAPW